MTKELCICQICNCGQHRCPHSALKLGNDDYAGGSEYNDMYISKAIQPVKPIIPKSNKLTDDAPIDDLTTHKKDYQAHEIPERIKIDKSGYVKTEDPFDGSTEFRDQYIDKVGERAQPFKPREKRLYSGQFAGEPVYKTDYRKWDYQNNQKIIPDNNLKTGDGKFDGSATYASDFNVHDLSQLQGRVRPNRNYEPSKEKFDDTTGYRDSYVPYNQEKTSMLRPKENETLPRGDFYGDTTMKSDFTPKNEGRQALCKPQSALTRRMDPFYDMTTNKSDYRVWPIKSQSAIGRRSDNNIISGDFYGETTYSKDFLGKDFSKTLPIRPVDTGIHQTGEFAKDSSYKSEYVKWNTRPAEKIVHDGNLKMDGEHSDMLTISKMNYVPHRLDKRLPIRPVSADIGSGIPFEGSTTYGNSYVEKKPTICPARMIHSNKKQFKFVKQDPKTGHTFFEEALEDLEDALLG